MAEPTVAPRRPRARAMLADSAVDSPAWPSHGFDDYVLAAHVTMLPRELAVELAGVHERLGSTTNRPY